MEPEKTKGAAPSICQSATPTTTRDAMSELEPDPELDLAWLSHVAVIPLPEVGAADVVVERLVAPLTVGLERVPIPQVEHLEP